MKNINDIISSRKVRLTVLIIGTLLIAALIFHAGVVVGSHRAQFGRPSMMDRGFRPSFAPEGFEIPHGFISNDHGAVGTITALTLPTFLMQTRDDETQTILVGTSTVIRSATSTTSPTLSVGSQVVVLGAPDSQGRIDAKLIRVLPSTPPTP
jgi:hypothetical protein